MELTLNIGALLPLFATAAPAGASCHVSSHEMMAIISYSRSKEFSVASQPLVKTRLFPGFLCKVLWILLRIPSGFRMLLGVVRSSLDYFRLNNAPPVQKKRAEAGKGGNAYRTIPSTSTTGNTTRAGNAVSALSDNVIRTGLDDEFADYNYAL
ncbi:hypothetical protein BJ875DRAFT_484313 [Amylocarpus encephaloides]|uniref:Uncharacterized protein n=1 Tax=Amylocarpus encephaloides TaxID=45428 RepID=A0A9P7YJV0_9HELO|nr:hypothetical protein BJ875DRAFT_484313 [Amylocarpus encephaloides]